LQPIRLSLQRQRDFVADAAHELRTPLTIMRGAAELGLTTSSPLEQQAALEQTLVQTGHLTRLVEDLSLLARSDSGAVSVERAPVDLDHLVAETVEGVDILAEDRGVHLVRDVRGQARVLGDAVRLRQLLMILLDNALKHTPEGGTITVGVTSQGHRAQLQVRDTGSGIDPKDLPHLFDRFYRADKARSGDGTGLGLSIARWIAEVHGGQITAANGEQGATFTVTLPLAQ
jgi:signal transduction histidine kinase